VIVDAFVSSPAGSRIRPPASTRSWRMCPRQTAEPAPGAVTIYNQIDHPWVERGSDPRRALRRRRREAASALHRAPASGSARLRRAAAPGVRRGRSNTSFRSSASTRAEDREQDAGDSPSLIRAATLVRRFGPRCASSRSTSTTRTRRHSSRTVHVQPAGTRSSARHAQFADFIEPSEDVVSTR
jgi:hypothetical protein